MRDPTPRAYRILAVSSFSVVIAFGVVVAFGVVAPLFSLTQPHHPRIAAHPCRAYPPPSPCAPTRQDGGIYQGRAEEERERLEGTLARPRM